MYVCMYVRIYVYIIHTHHSHTHTHTHTHTYSRAHAHTHTGLGLAVTLDSWQSACCSCRKPRYSCSLSSRYASALHGQPAPSPFFFAQMRMQRRCKWKYFRSFASSAKLVQVYPQKYMHLFLRKYVHLLPSFFALFFLFPQVCVFSAACTACTLFFFSFPPRNRPCSKCSKVSHARLRC